MTRNYNATQRWQLRPRRGRGACHAFSLRWVRLVFLGAAVTALGSYAGPAASTADSAAPVASPEMTSGKLFGEGVSSWFTAMYTKARPFLPSLLHLWELQLPAEDFPECLDFPTTSQLSEDAQIVRPILHRLKQRTFFRIFKLSLLADTFADPRLNSLLRDNAGKCSEPQRCGLCQCSDDEIPQTWLQKPDEEFVDRRHAASFTRWTQDQSSRQPDDPFSMFKTPKRLQADDPVFQSAGSKGPGVYVDLLLNPPCFTKYEGGVVWRLLYEQVPIHPRTGNARVSAGGSASQDVTASFLDDLTAVQPGRALGDWVCSNNANLQRLLSGMQANIAALAAENFNAVADPPPPPSLPMTTPFPSRSNGDGGNGAPAPPVFSSNMDFFRARLALHPLRVQNLYFTFGILLRAACGLSDILQECSCETGNSREDLSTRAELLHMLNVTTSSLAACSAEFMKKPFFESSNLQFLQSTEGIDSILRCVPCEKCRLHGKIKLTALHIAARMLSSSGAMPSLERNQVTALINALYYFAESIRVVEHMQDRIFLHNICVYACLVATVLLLVLLVVYFVWSTKTRARRKHHQKVMLEVKFRSTSIKKRAKSA